MIAEHHDNFDCWNSNRQKWNSVNMGPKRDIAGGMAGGREEARPPLRHDRTPGGELVVLQRGQRGRPTGPLAGVPYDGTDPRYADLYWVGNEHPKENYYCPHGPAYIKRAWFERISDMIDRYIPICSTATPRCRTRTSSAASFWPTITTTARGGTTAASRPSTTASKTRRGCGSRTSSAA